MPDGHRNKLLAEYLRLLRVYGPGSNEVSAYAANFATDPEGWEMAKLAEKLFRHRGMILVEVAKKKGKKVPWYVDWFPGLFYDSWEKREAQKAAEGKSPKD